MLNVFWPIEPHGLQRGVDGAENIQHIQRIQHFTRKERFLEHCVCIEHDSTYSTFLQKEGDFEKMSLLSAELIQHAEIQSAFCRNTSTKKTLLSAERIQHTKKKLDHPP